MIDTLFTGWPRVQSAVRESVAGLRLRVGSMWRRSWWVRGAVWMEQGWERICARRQWLVMVVRLGWIAGGVAFAWWGVWRLGAEWWRSAVLVWVELVPGGRAASLGAVLSDAGRFADSWWWFEVWAMGWIVGAVLIASRLPGARVLRLANAGLLSGFATALIAAGVWLTGWYGYRVDVFDPKFSGWLARHWSAGGSVAWNALFVLIAWWLFWALLVIVLIVRGPWYASRVNAVFSLVHRLVLRLIWVGALVGIAWWMFASLDLSASMSAVRMRLEEVVLGLEGLRVPGVESSSFLSMLRSLPPWMLWAGAGLIAWIGWEILAVILRRLAVTVESASLAVTRLRVGGPVTHRRGEETVVEWMPGLAGGDTEGTGGDARSRLRELREFEARATTELEEWDEEIRSIEAQLASEDEAPEIPRLAAAEAAQTDIPVVSAGAVLPSPAPAPAVQGTIGQTEDDDDAFDEIENEPPSPMEHHGARVLSVDVIEVGEYQALLIEDEQGVYFEEPEDREEFYDEDLEEPVMEDLDGSQWSEDEIDYDRVIWSNVVESPGSPVPGGAMAQVPTEPERGEAEMVPASAKAPPSRFDSPEPAPVEVAAWVSAKPDPGEAQPVAETAKASRSSLEPSEPVTGQTLAEDAGQPNRGDEESVSVLAKPSSSGLAHQAPSRPESSPSHGVESEPDSAATSELERNAWKELDLAAGEVQIWVDSMDSPGEVMPYIDFLVDAATGRDIPALLDALGEGDGYPNLCALVDRGWLRFAEPEPFRDALTRHIFESRGAREAARHALQRKLTGSGNVKAKGDAEHPDPRVRKLLRARSGGEAGGNHQ